MRPGGISLQPPEGAQMVARLVATQSSLLAFRDSFWLTGWAAFLMLQMILILQCPVKGAAAAVGAC